jgi:cytochrome P450
MSDLSDAIKALETDAQYLRDNLRNLDDPPNTERLKLVRPLLASRAAQSFLRSVTAAAKKQAAP